MAEMAMCHPNLEILWLIFTSPSSGTALCHFVFSAPAALCHFEAAKPDKPVGGRSRSPHRPKSSVVNKSDEMIAPDSSMQLVSFFGETWQTFEANNVERVVHFEVHRRVVWWRVPMVSSANWNILFNYRKKPTKNDATDRLELPGSSRCCHGIQR